MADSKASLALIGYTLGIGAFFGFVLSHGDLVGAGIGAIALTILGVVYLLTLGKDEVDLSEDAETTTGDTTA